MRNRLNLQQISECIHQLFGELQPGLSESIQECARPSEIKKGAVLFHQNEHGDHMYIVVRGRLRIEVKQLNGTTVTVNEVGRHEAIGEIALFIDKPRNATVTAIRDSLLLEISRDNFEVLSARWPRFALMLSRAVVERLTDTASGSASNRKVATIITVVSSHDELDQNAFQRRLCEALEKHGSVLSLNSDNIETYLRSEGLSALVDREAPSLISSWIDELESRYQFVICDGGLVGTRWARHSVRYADKVILLGDANVQKTMLALQRPMMQSLQAECEFINLHCDRAAAVVDTQLLVAESTITRHHHLCLNRSADFDRVARFIAGRAVGLVLAGGGARGFAHIGVVRALREHGVPIDYVGGTSMGAIIAAFVAMDMSDDEIYAVSKKAFVVERPLRDYTLPLIALLKGGRIDRLLKTYTRNAHIEDLWLNYFCVSASLTNNTSVVHESGMLWEAIRASIALPGILPPMIRDTHLLIDGGLINNLPVDEMVSRGVGRTIAVDLRGGEKQLTVCSKTLPTNTQILARLIRGGSQNDGHEDIPGLFEIVLRSSLVGSNRHANENIALAELYLNPPVEEIGLLDFNKFERIVDIGYEYASAELDGSPMTL